MMSENFGVNTEYLYSARDIDSYVNTKIRYGLWGFQKDHKFLLRFRFMTKGSPCYVLYSGAVDTAGEAPLDFFFDKNKQTAPDLGRSDDRKDVFDELMPVMLPEDNCKSKILFPFNITNYHWLTGEIIIHKEGENVSLEIYTHDPHGGGKLSRSNYDILSSSLKNRIEASGFCIKSITAFESPFINVRQSLEDHTSCGVITAKEIVQRISDTNLNRLLPYPVGAKKLRLSQLKFLLKKLGEENPVCKAFKNRVTNFNSQNNFVDIPPNESDDLTKLTSNLTISKRGYSSSDGDDSAQSEQHHSQLQSYNISESQFFPRCEYKARFEGSSIFQMSDPEHWGTYFRSTAQGGDCDRIAKLEGNKKFYENINVNKPADKNKNVISAAKAGSIYSPWKYDKYKTIFYKKPKIPEVSDKNNIFLYDSLLEYKTNICLSLVKKFKEQTIENQNKLNVYFENDYPCIMVQIKELNEILGIKEQRSIYKILGAYFTAITNYVAYSNYIPIELVNRASFGHNIPSIAETGTSFRINIGVVPEIYAKKVLVTSLSCFNKKFLLPLLNKELKVKLTQEQVTGYNEKVDKYMTDVYKDMAKLNLDDNLFDVLCKVGDKGGKKISYQIVRKKQYIDLLTDYVYTEMETNSPDFARPLRKVLSKLNYRYNNKIKKYQLTLEVFENEYNCKYQGGATVMKFPVEEDKDIKNDEKFWKIIENISSVFKALSIDNLSEAISDKKLTGLYSMLEKANLEYIRNSSYQNSEDGYGSESEIEVSIEGTTFYSKKITVGNGMRAINLAQTLSTYEIGSTDIDTRYMYFETSKSIKQIKDILKDLNLERINSTSQSKVRYIDLSHCAAQFNSTVDIYKIQKELHEEERVIVLDYTSTETKKLNEAIKLFIKKVAILLLVSSGMKNEQLGADMNPYGTLRIVARDYDDLNRLYYVSKTCLDAGKEKCPKQLHNIRKAYKDAGAVVTNRAIYNKLCKNRDCYFQPNAVRKNNRSRRYRFPDEITKIFNLFSTNKYGEELRNLKDIHKQNIADIICWDVDKITFLGSGDVKWIVHLANNEHCRDNFNQISNCYSENTEETKNLVYDICDSNDNNACIVFDTRNFKELFSEYLSLKWDPWDDENIIDKIAAKDEKDSCFEGSFISTIARSSGWELNTDDESSE